MQVSFYVMNVNVCTTESAGKYYILNIEECIAESAKYYVKNIEVSTADDTGLLS
jgi:hypothetical protein